jgi:hypothetical protein
MTSGRCRVSVAIVPRGILILLLLGLVVAGGGWLVTAQPQTGQAAPEITGGPWINSEPLTVSGLRGRVVLVEFWTYG